MEFARYGAAQSGVSASTSAAQFLDSPKLRGGLNQFRFGFGKIHLTAPIAHRLLGATLCFQRGGLVQIMSAQCSVRQYGNQVALNLEHAAGNKKELFFAGLLLHPYFASLEAGQ
jgi:hypothetical protein